MGPRRQLMASQTLPGDPAPAGTPRERSSVFHHPLEPWEAGPRWGKWDHPTGCTTPPWCSLQPIDPFLLRTGPWNSLKVCHLDSEASLSRKKVGERRAELA